MTTAHRPTWAPARGGEEQGGTRLFVPSRQVSAKNQASHTQLKFRCVLRATAHPMPVTRFHNHYGQKQRGSCAVTAAEQPCALLWNPVIACKQHKTALDGRGTCAAICATVMDVHAWPACVLPNHVCVCVCVSCVSCLCVLQAGGPGSAT